MKLKMLVRSAVTVFAASVLLVAGEQPGSASPRYNCDYPYVCFYYNSQNWAFQQVTAKIGSAVDWVPLGSGARFPFAVYNSRPDAVAWLLLESGVKDCVEPHGVWLHNDLGTMKVATALKIISGTVCPA